MRGFSTSNNASISFVESVGVESDGGYEFTGGFKDKTTDTSTLTSGVSASDTTFPVADESVFNGAGGYAVVGDEIIEYSGTAIGQLTGVNRGEYGTTATSHSSGATVHDTAYAWDSTSGVNYTQNMVDSGSWLKFSLDRNVHLATDRPYWSDPTPTTHVDFGIFGGQHLPRQATKLFDFTTTAWSDGHTGSLYFQDLGVGDFLNLRFDCEVIPQTSNTTVEFALDFTTRNPSNLAPTFNFKLTATPINLGNLSVGSPILFRPIMTAYFASREDLYALALPVFKASAPVIVRPLTMLCAINR